MGDSSSGALTLVLILGALVLMVLLAYVPGKIARKRGHPSAEAIRICGIVGILFWPLWLVAYIWAYTGPDRSEPDVADEPDYHLGVDRRKDVPEDDPAFKAASRRERHSSAPR